MKARRRLALFLSLVWLAACASSGASGGGASDGVAGDGSRAERWITIRDFRLVGAVAASDRVVYFGSTAGLERYDSLRDEWLPPLTSADDLPDDRITALAVDRFGADVWIGTRRGLARLAFDDVVDVVWGPPPAPVHAILLDPRDGTAHALVAGTWWRGRGSSFEREAPPPVDRLVGPRDATDLDPSRVPWVDPLYVRSPLFRDLFRLTQVDRDSRGDWYAGTWGDNGRRWRAVGGDWEPLYYGLAGEGGGPVVAARDGMWFLPGGGERAALAHAGERGSWVYVVPRLEPALPSAVWRAGIALGDTLMLAGDFGLAWGVGPSWRSAGREGDIGPAAALAADGPVLWIGTEDGLVAWDRVRGRAIASALARRRITAIAVAPDAVFAGGEDGLWVAPRTGPPVASEDAVAFADSFVQVEVTVRGVRALALHGTALVVATDTGIATFDRATGARAFGVGEGQFGGRALALASDGENVWVGTEEGLARWRPATGEWRTYDARDGLAGAPVLHLLAQTGVVWASTPDGVSRFAWRGEP